MDVGTSAFISLSICLGLNVGSYGNVCLTFWGMAILSSKVFALCLIPIRGV